MLKLIKFDSNTYGVLDGTQLALGTRLEAATYLIEVSGVEVNTLDEVLGAFDKEGKNVADFGMNRYWTYIKSDDVSQYLPAPKDTVKNRTA